MIFVDTGAWYASLVPADPDHARAMTWLAANESALLTTDYVIDEILTLLRVRGERKRALRLGRDVPSVTVLRKYVRSLPKIFHDPGRLFSSFDDKGWSFTDCTSKMVMDWV